MKFMFPCFMIYKCETNGIASYFSGYICINIFLWNEMTGYGCDFSLSSKANSHWMKSLNSKIYLREFCCTCIYAYAVFIAPVCRPVVLYRDVILKSTEIYTLESNFVADFLPSSIFFPIWIHFFFCFFAATSIWIISRELTSKSDHEKSPLSAIFYPWLSRFKPFPSLSFPVL